MAMEIDYALMNKLVAKLTIDDDLYAALLTISAAVITEDSDLTDADEVLPIVIRTISEKFFVESEVTKCQQNVIEDQEKLRRRNWQK
jgi:hypothetical protein